MISVKVSKNVDDYKENVIGTLDLKKTKCVVKGAGAGAVIMLILCLLHVPPILACYAGFPVIGVFIYRGFYEKDGMTYDEAKRLKKEHSYDGVNYICSSGNDLYYYDELIRQYKKENSNEHSIKHKNDDGFFSLLKKYIYIGGAIVMVLLIAFVIFMILV
ncbi:MAG: PrgI family protein [Clostridiales bacterium]|nr:PrgI family protein [Clostridiales bacterium]